MKLQTEEAPGTSEVMSRKLGGGERRRADGTHLPRQSRVRQQTTSRGRGHDAQRISVHHQKIVK